MALIAADRVRETTATTGTGAYALAGAVTGFRAFSAVLANADTAYYAATDNVNWEVGLGTYTSVGNTLTRTTILASSNAGSAVSWSAGDKAIFLTYPASKSVLSDAANISGSSTVTLLDTNFTLQDDVDPTKQLKFQVANLGTGTTVTLTAPTASGTILTVTGGQTVSNKTVDNSNTVTIKDTLFTLQDDADTTKQLRFELSSITTANTRTLTVPDASGTLMLTGLGQTITGLKTFNDTAFAVRDNTDTTKSFVFDASGITTGTQRTLTVPNASGTIALTSDLIPAGTAMLFQQTAAPTGWTKQTTHNDKALRVVSGAASSGGTTAFSTVFTSRTPAGTNSSTTATGTNSSTVATGTVGSTTLTTTQIPSHTHTIPAAIGTGNGGNFQAGYGTDRQTSATGGGGSHNHSLTMDTHTHAFTGTAHTHTFTGTAMDFAVQYVDIIIATKD